MSYAEQNRKLRSALADIATYPLPVYMYDGKKFVPFTNARHLKDLAHDAVLPEIDSRPIPGRWKEETLLALERCIERLESAGFGSAALDTDGQTLVLTALHDLVTLLTAHRRLSHETRV